MASVPPSKRADIVCADCGQSFTPKPTGRLPVRCTPCATDHKARKSNARVSAWVNANREHVREYQRDKQAEWRKANPEKHREYSRNHHEKRKLDPEFRQKKRDNELKRVYGITRAELDEMRVAQNDLCAICQQAHVGPGTRLHVDHCHTNGKVRSLLCGKCNTLIGLADDSPERLELAANYLRHHGVT